MKSLLAAIDSVLKTLVALFMCAIVLAVSWQVLSRYLLGDPSSFSDELSRFLLIWIGMLGSAYCYRVKSHLSLNILTEKMADKKRWFATIFAHFMVFLFALLVMVVGGANLVSMTFDPIQFSPVLNIKIGYVYSVIPLSGALIAFYALVEIVTVFNLGADNFHLHTESTIEAD